MDGLSGRKDKLNLVVLFVVRDVIVMSDALSRSHVPCTMNGQLGEGKEALSFGLTVIDCPSRAVDLAR